MNALVEANLDIAFTQAQFYARKKRCDWQEYLSAAYLGLVQAAETFRDDCGASFRTHAQRRVLGAILDQRRAETGVRWDRKTAEAKAQRVPLEHAEFVISRNSTTDPVESADAVDYIIKMVDWTQQRKAKAKLRKSLRLIAEGYSAAEASREAGSGLSNLTSQLTRFRHS